MLNWIRSKLGAGRADSARLVQQAESAYGEGVAGKAKALCLRAIAGGDRGEARALSLLAAIAADEGLTEEGLRWAHRAHQADPDSVSPHYVAGRLCQDAGRLVEAEASYRAAIAIQPSHARAHNNLGCVLHMQGRLDEALLSYRRALDLDPDLPQANQNFAAIVRDGGALERAVLGYRRRTEQQPDDAMAFNDLGNSLRELGRHEEALAAYARALALAPGMAEAHFSRSFVLLLCGDYDAGWREYEWRWRIPAFNAPARRFALPIWDGSPVPEGAVLLHAEQGLGDTLQFVRYAPLVGQRCAGVILECQPELAALMRGVPGLRRVVARGETLPAFATHAPLMSLPAIFHTTLETIPWSGPYVRADPGRAKSWDLSAHAGASPLKVGLVWAGRPQQWDDRKRSISLDMLAPLARANGVAYFSLQVGTAAAQSAHPPAGMRLVDLTRSIADFSDTAALVSQLDLVITIDTSVAHLAGAMGVPAWVLVAHAPDWRYHLVREDQPWYPSMRLFRQQRDGDWSGAIEKVAAELERRAAQG